MDISRGKHAIEISNMGKLVALIETVRSADETDELDTEIEAVSGRLKGWIRKVIWKYGRWRLGSAPSSLSNIRSAA